MGGSSFYFCNDELLDRVEADRAEPDCVKRSARLKIGLANLAYNMRRFVWLHDRRVPA